MKRSDTRNLTTCTRKVSRPKCLAPLSSKWLVGRANCLVERVHLIQHCLRLVVEPNARQHLDIQKLNLNVAKLEEATTDALSSFFSDKDNTNNLKKKRYLKELFKLAKAEERYRNGEIGKTRPFPFPCHTVDQVADISSSPLVQMPPRWSMSYPTISHRTIISLTMRTPDRRMRNIQARAQCLPGRAILTVWWHPCLQAPITAQRGHCKAVRLSVVTYQCAQHHICRRTWAWSSSTPTWRKEDYRPLAGIMRQRCSP
jgi:hypothetical protein